MRLVKPIGSQTLRYGRARRRLVAGIVWISARRILFTASGEVNTSATAGSNATTKWFLSTRDAKRLGFASL